MRWRHAEVPGRALTQIKHAMGLLWINAAAPALRSVGAMRDLLPWLACLTAAFEPARRSRRPELALVRTSIDGRLVPITQRPLVEKPFCRLVRLERDTRRDDPRVLVVTPLSGHFPALLRDLLAALAPDHDLYITDWADARDVPFASGRFGVEENIDYVLECIRYLEAPRHVVALCQSAMPALAATALLAARNDVAQPQTLTLMNGMLDARIAPTRIDRLARSRSLAWFERNALAVVPTGCAGEGRLVHPASFQHAALTAYLARHLATGGELSHKILWDDGEKAADRPFLELYLSLMDLPAEFFLDTIKLVFHEFALPRHELFWRGERVEPAAIAKTALMTVEGELDDVSAPGQTRVAHELCRCIPGHRRGHRLEPGIGHFGVFHGRVWRCAIMPRVRAFIRDMV